MQPSFRARDLVCRLVDVEESGAHRRGDLVEVADLRQDFLRELAESVEATAPRNCATMPQREVVIGERAGGGLDVSPRTSRDDAVVAHAIVFFPFRITKQQMSYVLDSVEVDV